MREVLLDQGPREPLLLLPKALLEKSLSMAAVSSKYCTWNTIIAFAQTCRAARELVEQLKRIIPLGLTINKESSFRGLRDNIEKYQLRNVSIYFRDGFPHALILEAVENEAVRVVRCEEKTFSFAKPASIPKKTEDWLKLLRGNIQILNTHPLDNPETPELKQIFNEVQRAYKQDEEFEEARAQFRANMVWGARKEYFEFAEC